MIKFIIFLAILLITTNSYAGITFASLDQISSSPMTQSQAMVMKLLPELSEFEKFIYEYTTYNDYKDDMREWEQNFSRLDDMKDDPISMEIRDKIFQKVTIVLMFLKRSRKAEALQEFDFIVENYIRLREKVKVGAFVYSGSIPISRECR